MYYWNFPEESKQPSSSDEGTYRLNDTPVSRDWWLSIQVSRLIRFWAALLMGALGWLVFWSGLPSRIGMIFAWILGIFSAILSMLQYLPQIYRTYQSKVLQKKSLFEFFNCLGFWCNKYWGNVHANARFFHLLLHVSRQSWGQCFHLVNLLDWWLLTRDSVNDLFVLPVLATAPWIHFNRPTRVKMSMKIKKKLVNNTTSYFASLHLVVKHLNPSATYSP